MRKGKREIKRERKREKEIERDREREREGERVDGYWEGKYSALTLSCLIFKTNMWCHQQ